MLPISRRPGGGVSKVLPPLVERRQVVATIPTERDVGDLTQPSLFPHPADRDAAAAPATWDTTYRFVAQGSTTEPRQFSDGDRGGDFLGRPKIEWSTMGTGAATGTKLILAGQFDQFVIVDRIDATIELVPLLMGATNRFPTGQRGAYFYSRVGSGVLNPGAFVYLEVK
jgi:hypothetical protein